MKLRTLIGGLFNWSPGGAAPRPAPPAADAHDPTVDRVELNCWGEFQKLRWLEGEKAALGAILSPALATSLGQSLGRIHQAGVELSFSKALFFTTSPENAGETMEVISSRAPGRLKGNAELPDGSQYPVNDLKDLMTLDLFCGGGEAPDIFTEKQVRAFRSLDDLGWKFQPKKEEETGVLSAFRRSGDEPMNIHVKAPDGWTNLLYQRQDAVSLDFFKGSGSDADLANQNFARGLKAVEDQGFRLGIISGGWYGDSAFETYRGNPFPVADSEKWMIPISQEDGYSNPFWSGVRAMPVRTEEVTRWGNEGRVEQEYEKFTKAIETYASDLPEVDLKCGLNQTRGAEHSLDWEAFMKGLGRLYRMAPDFETTPLDLGNLYAKLLQGCDRAEAMEERLNTLEALYQGRERSEFKGLVAEAIHKHAVTRLQEAQSNPTELNFEEDLIEVGEFQLPVG